MDINIRYRANKDGHAQNLGPLSAVNDDEPSSIIDSIKRSKTIIRESIRRQLCFYMYIWSVLYEFKQFSNDKCLFHAFFTYSTATGHPILLSTSAPGRRMPGVKHTFTPIFEPRPIRMETNGNGWWCNLTLTHWLTASPRFSQKWPNVKTQKRFKKF